MLGFEERGARFAVLVVDEVGPVIELGLLPKLFDFLRLQTVTPRKRQRHFAGTVVLDVALGADEGPHFLTRRQAIRIVRLVAGLGTPADDTRQLRDRCLAGGEPGDSLQEARTGDA